MIATIGSGVYSYQEAARLTGLKPSRVREWFRSRRPKAGRSAVFAADYAPVDGDFAISFYDLIDVFVAGQLREHGVSLPTVRRVYKRMRENLGAEHPFCRKELLSDGKIVFMRGADAAGKDDLVEVLTRQKVFPEILLPFLMTIEYDKLKLLALRWHIADEIVVDPQICFGAPIVAAAGIPTAILANAYRVNGDNANAVADWYNVTAKDVLAAVRFETERRLAA